MTWWKRLLALFRRAPRKADPLAIYDRQLDGLAKRVQALRRSAASLLAARRELDRKLEAGREKLAALLPRIEQADDAGDRETGAILQSDRARIDREMEHLSEQRLKAGADAEALIEAVGSLEQQREALAREREDAQLRVAAAAEWDTAHGALASRFDEVIALDSARDEVERAHQLAQIYREEALLQRVAAGHNVTVEAPGAELSPTPLPEKVRGG